MGRWHAHYAAAAGATIVAVVDRDPRRAGLLSKRFPAAASCASLEQALAGCEADVVHICVPTSAHGALAAAAIDRGAHVLAEKPMAATAQETQHLVSLARARGVLINPVHQFPFERGFRRLQGDRHRLGDAVRIDFRCCTAGAERLSAPAHRELMIEILPHPMSLFYGLFGERVFESLAVTAAGAGDLEIGGSLGDTRLAIAISLRARPTELSLNYAGVSGSGHVDLFHGFYVGEDGRVSRGAKMTRPLVRGASVLTAAAANLAHRALRSEWAYPGLRELIAGFYAAVRTGTRPPIDDEEIVGTAVALDRFRSAIAGTHVSAR